VLSRPTGHADRKFFRSTGYPDNRFDQTAGLESRRISATPGARSDNVFRRRTNGLGIDSPQQPPLRRLLQLMRICISLFVFTSNPNPTSILRDTRAPVNREKIGRTIRSTRRSCERRCKSRFRVGQANFCSRGNSGCSPSPMRRDWSMSRIPFFQRSGNGRRNTQNRFRLDSPPPPSTVNVPATPVVPMTDGRESRSPLAPWPTVSLLRRQINDHCWHPAITGVTARLGTGTTGSSSDRTANNSHRRHGQ